MGNVLLPFVSPHPSTPTVNRTNHVIDNRICCIRQRTLQQCGWFARFLWCCSRFSSAAWRQCFVLLFVHPRKASKAKLCWSQVFKHTSHTWSDTINVTTQRCGFCLKLIHNLSLDVLLVVYLCLWDIFSKGSEGLLWAMCPTTKHNICIMQFVLA